jgi:hypothetical protein
MIHPDSVHVQVQKMKLQERRNQAAALKLCQRHRASRPTALIRLLLTSGEFLINLGLWLKRMSASRRSPQMTARS